MSNPALGAASTVRVPVGARVPLLAGDWMSTWSVPVPMTNNVVAVPGSRSLLVYAAAVTPLVTPDAGGVDNVVSATVVWVLRSWRRFWPLSLITRRRSAAG